MRTIPIYIGLTLVFSLNVNTPKTQEQRATTAISTNDFLNSIGVNSAISCRGETLEKTISIIKYTGIRWIRSGYEGDVVIQDYLKLHKETGIRFSYGLMSGGTNINRLLKDARQLAQAGALVAIEGSNEPNNWPVNYNGEKGGKDLSWLAVAKLQKDLYSAVKSDPLLKSYPVWSLCENGAQTDNAGLQFLKIPRGAGTIMPEETKYADFATCHNYFVHFSNPILQDNQTWNAADPGPLCKVDGLYGNYGLTWKNKFQGYTHQQLKCLPKVTTETGVTIDSLHSEEQQARLYLNLYLAQFKRKWSYTSVYLLRDRSDETGNQSFGFYRPDYTPRKAAIYMHNFTTILADKYTARKKAVLSYSLINPPETIHDLLLHNSNGKFQLVIWSEKINGMETLEVKLKIKARLVKIYDPTLSSTPIKTLTNIANLKLRLSDHPLIVEL
jgi:hypothetical protein